VGACLALALSIGTAGAQEPAATPLPKYFNIERYQWQAEPELSAAVRRVVVRNDYGDIRTRFAGDGIVLVSAIVQRLGPTADIGLNIERHGEALAITVVAPPGRRAVAAERPAKTDVDRADIVVYVPEKAALDAVTLRGMIETRRLKSRVDAQTDTGEIRLETEGPVRARSVSGDVSVSLAGTADAASVIETASGNIWLSLLEGGHRYLAVETSGKVTSKLDLQDAPGTNGRHQLTGGAPGGVPVIVRSETGGVEIVQRRQ
jgi:hypothetical protein